MASEARKVQIGPNDPLAAEPPMSPSSAPRLPGTPRPVLPPGVSAETGAPPEAGSRPVPLVSPARSAALAAGLFLVVGVAWIVFSDRALGVLAPTPEAFASLQTWKGTVFVGATALLLFALLHAQFSRRNRQAHRLLAAAERLRAQIENSPLALLELDADFRVTRWSARAEELFGWRADEVIGRSLDEVGFVHPDDRDELNELLERSRREGGTGSINHNRNLRADGSVVYCEWYNSWLRDSEGRVTTVLSLAQDVTWQREAVDEVRRMNRELEARVHRRTEQLSHANADLKAFSYSISHDLRAPVRAIIGFGEILERRYTEALPDEGRRYLGLIVEAGTQMNALIDGLLRYGRVDHEAVTPEALDPGQVVRGLLPRFDALLSGSEGSIQIADPLPVVTGDRALLESVFQNLIQNALKYRHPDRPPRVRIEGEVSSEGPVLRIKDNGMGVPEDDRERIFGLFERVAATSGTPGAGLGLSIVRRSLERMGATIRVDAGDGNEGSTFVMAFPPGHLASEGAA
jgi:PAS domain S-box-containing protein